MVTVIMPYKANQKIMVYRQIGNRFFIKLDSLINVLKTSLNSEGVTTLSKLQTNDGFVSDLNLQLLELELYLKLDTLQLFISLPAKFMKEIPLNLAASTIDFTRVTQPTTSPFYGYINTNITLEKSEYNDTSFINSILEPVLQLRNIRLKSSFYAKNSSQTASYFSGTQLSYRKQKSFKHLSLGYQPFSIFNGFSRSPLASSSLWGIQYISNLKWALSGMEPKPMHEIPITIKEKATLRIDINDKTVVTRWLEKGVYHLSNIPYVNGLNNVTIYYNDTPVYTEKLRYNRHTLGKNKHYLDYSIGVPYTPQQPITGPLQGVISYKRGLSDTTDYLGILSASTTQSTLYSEHIYTLKHAEIRPLWAVSQDKALYLSSAGLLYIPFSGTFTSYLTSQYNKNHLTNLRSIQNNYTIYQTLTPTYTLRMQHGIDTNLNNHQNSIRLSHELIYQDSKKPYYHSIRYQSNASFSQPPKLGVHYRFSYGSTKKNIQLNASLQSHQRAGELEASFSWLYRINFDGKASIYGAQSFSDRLFLQRSFRQNNTSTIIGIDSSQNEDNHRDLRLKFNRQESHLYYSDTKIDLLNKESYHHMNTTLQAYTPNGYINSTYSRRSFNRTKNPETNYRFNWRSSIIFNKETIGIGQPIDYGFIFIKKHKSLKGVKVGFRELLKESLTGNYVYPIKSLSSNPIRIQPNSISSVRAGQGVLNKEFGIIPGINQGYFTHIGSNKQLILSCKLIFEDENPPQKRLGYVYEVGNEANKKSILINEDGRFIATGFSKGSYIVELPGFQPKGFKIDPTPSTIKTNIYYQELTLENQK